MTDLQPFVFPATGQAVRTVLVDGEPWFVANDVCLVLDLHPGRAMTRIDDDEKGVRSTQTPGGLQELVYVNEPGLYSLVLGSRKAEAKAFKRWVTHEVLPAIRRTGTYSTTPASRLPDITTAEGVLAMAEQFAATARQLVQADAKIRELEPKAIAHDTYLTADAGDRLVREVAKLIGWKEKDLRAFMLDEKLIFRRQALCGTNQYDVYAAHAKHFKPVEEIVQRRIKRKRAAIEAAITGGGA